MDDRKDYVAPAIAWEDVLEQTSLACHATESPPLVAEACFGATAQQESFAPGLQCSIDVSKGGAFWDDAACTTFPEGVVVLS